jgi:hypothetical protein
MQTKTTPWSRRDFELQVHVEIKTVTCMWVQVAREMTFSERFLVYSIKTMTKCVNVVVYGVYIVYWVSWVHAELFVGVEG